MCIVDRNIPAIPTSASDKVVTGTFLKAAAGARTGISVARRNRDNAIVISKIEPGKMASTTSLKTGMRFLRINNQTITHLMSCQEVADLLIQASGMVTVIAAPGLEGY